MAEVKTDVLLRFLAKGIDEGFNGKQGPDRPPPQTAFFLAIMPYDADFSLVPKPAVHYIANMEDPRIAEMLKDVFEGFGYHTFLKAPKS